jgi:hypothetical protein
MAGKYIELINPGYSTLWTRDLKYAPGSGEAATLDPFNPKSLRPLVEGEWLEVGGSTGKQLTRGGDNVTSVPGTPDGEGTVPAYLHFMEQGRYDQQATKRAHVVMGPAGFEFRTRLCNSAGLSPNDPVSVWDWDGPGGAWGVTRRVLAAHTAGWVIGRVTRIYGTNDIGVMYLPGSSS